MIIVDFKKFKKRYSKGVSLDYFKFLGSAELGSLSPAEYIKSILNYKKKGLAVYKVSLDTNGSKVIEVFFRDKV